MTATNIVMAKTIDSFVSNRLGLLRGSTEMPTPTLLNATTAPVIGVRKPTRSKVPAVMAMPPTNQADRGAFGCRR